jgi:dynein heavy chain
MTNEPSKEMKANILRSMLRYYDKILNDYLEPTEYRKLIYSLCCFYALIFERKNMGRLVSINTLLGLQTTWKLSKDI